MTGVWQEITEHVGYNTLFVVLGTTLLGIAAGVIGAFSVLRKRALLGDALAHSTLPGLCVAFLFGTFFLGPEKSLLLLLTGAAISGALGVLSVYFLTRFTRLREDAAIGVVLSVYFGAGIVLLSYIQTLGKGEAGGLHHFIYGQTAALTHYDAQLMFFTAIGVLLISAIFFKELRVLCFDEIFAQSIGMPVKVVDLMLLLMIVIVTVTGLQSVGLILIVSLLIIPCAAARFWSDQLRVVVGLSGLFGGLSGLGGSIVSALYPRMPTGAVIVLTAGVIFLISFLFAPSRGLAAAFIRRFLLRLRVIEEHILRHYFESCEASPRKEHLVIPLVELARLAGQGAISSIPLIVVTYLRGLFRLSLDPFGMRITDRGLQQAARYTRNHRLWETYLLTFSHADSSHVDYSADYVEHVLSPEIVAELESALASGKFLSQHLASQHPLETPTNE